MAEKYGIGLRIESHPALLEKEGIHHQQMSKEIQSKYYFIP